MPTLIHVQVFAFMGYEKYYEKKPQGFKTDDREKVKISVKGENA